MSLYLIVNITIISVPFVCLFIPSLRAFRHFKAMAVSIGLVSSLFIVWDVIAQARGHWAFNPDYVGPHALAGLPIEEWLFFITVPFSCLFLYDVFDHYFTKNNPTALIKHYKKPVTLAGTTTAFFLVVLGMYLWPFEYTSVVFILSGIWLFFTLYRDYDLFTSKAVLLYLGVGIVLFCIFNTILTSLPIVTYGPLHSTGIRLGTIPLEDFFYNMLLLGLYVQVYRWLITQEKPA
jgi:lycopene cyclase domain-containing protein